MKNVILTRGSVLRSLLQVGLICLVAAGCTGLKSQLALNRADYAFARQDYGKAMAGYQEAADQGNAAGQYHLGHMYLTGRGADKNPEQAQRWLTLSAHQGYAPAQFMLGLWYLSGDGVTADPAQAAQWLVQAAGKGHALAQYHLGLMHATGRGVSRDPAKALSLLKQAAAGGCPVAPELLTPAGLEQLGHKS